MVALNPSMTESVAVVPLDVTDTLCDPGVSERAELAVRLGRHRKARREQGMGLHTNSAPPTPKEVATLHELFKANTQIRRSGASELPDLVPMRHTVVESSMVVFSEKRNCHGKLFGGFIAQHAFEQAYFCAYRFTGEVPVPLGFDEMVFERPVSIGDLVRFETQIVQTKERVMRVWVHVDVLDPKRPQLVQTRTNKMAFVFLQPSSSNLKVVPDSYSECVMHVSAGRWHAWQGPSPEDLMSRGVLEACDGHADELGVTHRPASYYS
eukprot:gnl/TRDRNA2_/TRDRNA2_34801_c0_seq1.p1 gnl/TRDRNA2_/TRDRNA2_34801_c0~~gnl/TRDRNA2_/TRDRNA2_34801_c0_seq1.p1  ORF type:complete len:266 (+),score=30.00 gnl/TRDRNA2_/TRDRNA2_34801_c0_seq1:56-853(+)